VPPRSRCRISHLWTAAILRRACPLGSKADMKVRPCDVRFTPESGHSFSVSGCPLCAKLEHFAPQQYTLLFDHLIGDGEQPRRHGKAERFGGLHINNQLEFRRLNHGLQASRP
jgi:hypothetical protein